MELNYSHYTFDELCDIREAINLEFTKRKKQLREERFNAMMKAIREFKEVCPYAKVCNYEDYVSITEIADRNLWEFCE